MVGRSTAAVAAADESSPAAPMADDGLGGSEEEKKEEGADNSAAAASTPQPSGPSGDGAGGDRGKDRGKDRRAMLEEWRRKKALERSASSASNSPTWNGYRSPPPQQQQQQQQSTQRAKGGGVHRSRSSASLTGGGGGGGGGAARKNPQHQHHHRSGSSPPMYHQHRRKQPLPQAATQQAKNVPASRQRRKEAVGGDEAEGGGDAGAGAGGTVCAPPPAPNRRRARRRHRRAGDHSACPPQPPKQSPSTTSPAAPTAKGETPMTETHAKEVGLKLATTDSDLLDGEGDDTNGTPSPPWKEGKEEMGTERSDDGVDEDEDEDEEVRRARHMALAASALSGLPPDEIRRRAVAVFGGSASPSLSSSGGGTVDLFFTPPSSPPRRILRVGGGAGAGVEGSETRRVPRANDDGEVEAQTREVLRRHVHDLTSQLVRTKADRDEARSALASTLENLRDVEARAADLRKELDDVTREAERASAESARVLAEVEAETDSYAARLVAVAAELDRVGEERRLERGEMERRHAEEVDGLRFALRVQRHEDAGARGGAGDGDGDGIDDGTMTPAVALARIEERDERIAELEAAVARGEGERRAMHNRIQELRGNIRVYVRARPFVRDDLAGGDGGEESGDEGADDLALSSPISVTPDGQGLVVADVRNGNEELSFKFDKVFGPAAGQEDVFREVSELVQSALDGYNVCLFSYGQTGSGKTHTMQGSGAGEMRGIIPRAVELVMKQARALADHQKWEFEMTASFLEIYNEAIRDLLPRDLVEEGEDSQSGEELSDASSHGSGKRGSKRSAGAKLSIKRDPNGRLYVQGLNRVSVDPTDGEVGARRLDAVMAAAAACRSVASTAMNAQSSRSHAVFVLDLRGRNRDTGAVVTGALHLCDLAGSERLDRTGHDVSTAEGSRRMKEVQSINRSLSTLGDVFNALAVGSPHVPYRNSKLTYLLQDCLGGDGKALMFVNLSPTSESCGESLCSLRFAQRVNQVELGKASKNVQLSNSKVGKV